MTDIHCAKTNCRFNNDSACGREVTSNDRSGTCLMSDKEDSDDKG